MTRHPKADTQNPKPKTQNPLYDAVIVGAGPAGLTCAIFLGRYRRRVAMVDSGKGRNYATDIVHGFLGQHGIEPGELRRRGREEAASVGVELISGTVTGIEKSGDCFEVTTNSGVLKGRRVVLAYGVRDIKPNLPDFETYYGRSIFHCPDCDGYEIRDKPIGVIGTGKRVAGLALKLLQWTDQITVFSNGKDDRIGKEEMSKLQAEGIEVREELIVRLLGSDGNLRALELDSGDEFSVAALFFNLGTERSTTLAEDLGCRVFEGIPCIEVDEYKQTSVEGVYAVGDLVPGAQLAITSAADGAICAIALNKTLLPPSRQV